MDGEVNPVESFFNQPGVEVNKIAVGTGVPLGIEPVFNPKLRIGGVYGTWGESYDNNTLPGLIEERTGSPLSDEMKMNLSELGFDRRHHLSQLSDDEHLEVELEVGAQFLRRAAQANGWNPAEVDAVLVGVSGPAFEDYTEQIARRAGIPESAIKVSIHKACDSSMGALHLALNPDLPVHERMGVNLAKELKGKKVLVGGIEGLSRFMREARDLSALQLFGNGAGVIGIIPGETMKFLVGKTHEAYDEEGVLAIRMCYPHSGRRSEGNSLVEVSHVSANHFRVAGFMHQPTDESPVAMAGPMGMVKLFVRTGVQVMRDVYQAYQEKRVDFKVPGKNLAVAIVHHANYKINKLIEKNLQKEGIHVPMPWLLTEFGNVSAASNMIAFLRQLPKISPGDHILFDGFGAGTYYDAFAVEMGC